MRENKIRILVTAHHSEDQIETILLHVLRGSGIKGACGMSECRAFANDFYLVRPLLNAMKQDILSYCNENCINFVTDSTNDDTQYARNHIRHEIVPKLYELQANLCGSFERFSKSASEADDFINACALEFIAKNCENGVPVDKFNENHIALRKHTLFILFKEFCSATLECVHIDALIELCEKAEPHSSISLPSRVKAQIENGMLVFLNDESKALPHPLEKIPFCDGIIDTHNGIIINIERNPTKKVEKSPLSLDIKCAFIENDAHFRSRQEGDTIFSGNLNKKVKKLLSEKKIPLE